MKYATAFLVTLFAHTAVADSSDAARAASDRGRAALKAGRVHEACDAFAESEKLAASVDTELSLASCYERDGKPVSAAALYRTAAEHDANAERRDKSLAKAAKLEAKAPKLRFAINPNPPGLVVKVDGKQVSATADVLVDTGPHDVVATAPGYEGHASAPVDREGAILDVIIRMEERPETAPAPTTKPADHPVAPAPPAPMRAESAPMRAAATSMTMPSHRKRNGLIVGGAGIAMLVGAGVTFAVSASKVSDEHDLCPDSKCSSAAKLEMANSLISDARTYRGVSIGMGIGGGVLTAIGAYLVLTHDANVSVEAERGGATVAYSIRF